MVEKTRENHQPAVGHCQTWSHNDVRHATSESRTHNTSEDMYRLRNVVLIQLPYDQGHDDLWYQ